MMKVFPFFQDMTDRTFLVVGAGSIARRKIRLILQFTDRVLVITNRKAGPDQEAGDLTAFEEAGAEVLNRAFRDADLEMADFCIASSDDSALNHHIAELCLRRGIPVNVPDDPAWCSFYLPAVIKKGDLIIAVSTGGKSPAMAGWLRRRLEKDLPDHIEEILDIMGRLREWLPDRVADSGRRGRIYKEVLAALTCGELEVSENGVRDYVLKKLKENGSGDQKQEEFPAGPSIGP